MDTTTQPRVPQHIVALSKANEIRIGRATLKRRIASGEVSLASLLDSRGEISKEAVNMTILELLCAQHQWGRCRALKLLAPLAIREQRRVGTLVGRERDALVSALEGHRVEDRRVLAA